MNKSATFFIISVFLISCLYNYSNAQVADFSPEGFTYQAEARDVNGNVLANEKLSVRFIIFQDDIGGTVVWREIQQVTTDNYGLFTLVIGEGSSDFDFSQIDWGNHNYYLNVSIKRFNDRNWINNGTTQLMSVPYALHAKTAGRIKSIEKDPYIKQLVERIYLLQKNTLSGRFTDTRDGNTYKWVTIGNQIWMAENLRWLPAVKGPLFDYFSSVYYVYGYDGTDVNEAKATENYTTYGVLYNWWAAMNGDKGSMSKPSGVQGACPAGWHLPSDSEWSELKNYIGYDGGKLKETGTTHWLSPNTGATNESGFSALPGGARSSGNLGTGNFYGLGTYCCYWSTNSSIIDVNSVWASHVGLKFDNTEIDHFDFYKHEGYSVRCISDY